MRRLAVVVSVIATWMTAEAAAQRPVTPADLARERYVSDPQVSPDGAWVAYTLSVSDTAKDQDETDVWLAS